MAGYGTVFALRNIPGSLFVAPVVLHKFSTPCNAFLQHQMRISQPTGTHGCGSRQCKWQVLVLPSILLWYSMYSSLQAVRGRSGACLFSSLHFQEIGRRHATGHTRHPLPHVDRSTVGYLFCRLLYQYYLPDRHTHMHALWVHGLCSLHCHVCYRFNGNHTSEWHLLTD